MVTKEFDCDTCVYDGTTMCSSCIHEYTDREDHYEEELEEILSVVDDQKARDAAILLKVYCEKHASYESCRQCIFNGTPCLLEDYTPDAWDEKSWKGYGIK